MGNQPGSETDEVLYRESIYFTWLALGLIAVFGFVTAVLVVDLLKQKPRLSLIGITCIFIFISAYLNFRRLLFEVTNNRVRFRFGLIKKEFLRADITSCEPYELTFRNYLGWGIRYGLLDGTVAYNTRFGRGVKMVVAGRKRPYVVSVDDPERVCDLLRPKVN
jgi:hypothetical protein